MEVTRTTLDSWHFCMLQDIPHNPDTPVPQSSLNLSLTLAEIQVLTINLSPLLNPQGCSVLPSLPQTLLDPFQIPSIQKTSFPNSPYRRESN
jgi:hypothetical protein